MVFELKSQTLHDGVVFREIFESNKTNDLGERILVEFSYQREKCQITSDWKKYGCTEKELNSYISCQVSAINYKNEEKHKYNPTVKVMEWETNEIIIKSIHGIELSRFVNKVPHKQKILNFDWVLECSEENRNRLLEKIEEMAFQKVGK